MAADLTISVDIDARKTKAGAAEAKSQIKSIGDEAVRAGGRFRSLASIDLSSIAQKLKEVGPTIREIGSQIQSVGTSLSVGLTAPLVALATFGIRSALEFDKVRTKITALVGDSEKANAKITELRNLADNTVGVTQKSALETFAQLKGIGDIADESINKIIGSLGKLNAAFNLEDQSGFLRNLTQIFSQGFEIADIKEAIGRVPIFQQLLEQAFGTKDPAKLKALKDAGKLTLDQFLTGISDAINSDPRTGKITENLSTKLAKGLEKLNVALAPLGQILLDAIVPAVEKAAPYVERLSQFFQALSPEVKTAAVAFGALVAAIGPALVVIGAVVGAIGSIVTAVGALAGSAATVGIVAAAIVGIGLQMAPLIAYAAALYAAWQTNFGGIRDLTGQVAEFIKGAWAEMKTRVAALTEELTAELKVFWEQNGDDIMKAVQAVSDFIQSIWTAIAKFWSENGESIRAATEFVWGAIAGIVKGGMQLILQTIKLVAAIINGDWQKAWDALIEIVKLVFRAIVSYINAEVTVIVAAVRKLFEGILGLQLYVIKLGRDLGIDLVQGIINGIGSMTGPLGKVAASIINATISRMRETAQTQSPSKVTFEIGQNIAEGLTLGMANGTAAAAKAAEDVAGSALETIQGIFGGDFEGFLRNTFDVLTDGSRSFGDRLKTIFGGIAQNFRRMVSDMASSWLSSIFGGGSGSGTFSNGTFGGTPPFSGSGGGGFRIPGDRTGTIDSDGNVVVDGRSTIGKITGPGGIFGSEGFGNNVGTYGAFGAGANLVGGLIGGRVGGFISNIGTGVALGAQIGSIIPGIGTAIGAVVGGAVGFFASLFGGDPKRKRDKKEKLPQLNQGFTDALAELRNLVADVRTLRVSPDTAISRATELRNAIASGFGIQFESKKYKKQAATLIAQRTREADTLIEELRKVAEISRAAGERERRILPEFATGVFMSSGFMQQYSEFKRRNGVLSGGIPGVDSLPSLLKAREMVLNEEQQRKVIKNAGGVDPFRGAGIPGYAAGVYVGGGQAPAQPQSVNVSSGDVVVQVFVEQDTAGIWKASAKSSDGRRVITEVVEDGYRNGDLELKRR